MYTNVNVKAFLKALEPTIRQITTNELSDSIMTRAEALQRLTTLGRSSLGDMVDYGTSVIGEDPDGNEIKQSWWHIRDSVKNDPEKMQAVRELTAGPGGLKIKINDPVKSIETIAKMEKWTEEAGEDDETIPEFSEILSHVRNRAKS